MWLVTYNGAALETTGLTFANGSFSLSPIAVITFGFLVGTQDIWTPCEQPEAVTWTECECD